MLIYIILKKNFFKVLVRNIFINNKIYYKNNDLRGKECEIMSDIEIANKVKCQNILEIAEKLGISKQIETYGENKAKIRFQEITQEKKGKLILVTAISPTPYGEGKTTVSIGLNDGLRKLNKNSVAVLREPSLGPVFGVKGGATGGGYAQVIPMEDINLHFTGDFHAITTANNLISAAIDNHLYFGNQLNIDPKQICFQRCLDMNDRALRHVELGDRTESFNITAASEIMSILCLSNDIEDLKKRLGNILIAYSKEGTPIYTRDLKLEGSLVTILKEAINPNLVQSLEHNPVIIHGGPFANIAHGCNSIIATNLGLKIADYVVTEAGFGSDLGAEKFLDIKCRTADISPNAIVIVATTKALKYHGGVAKEDITKKDIVALQKGLSNLDAHLENMLTFTKNVMITLNYYDTDSEEEIEFIKNYVEEKGIHFSVSKSYTQGGEGALELAKQVVEICDQPKDFKLLYPNELGILEKIQIIAQKIYHAKNVQYTDLASKKIQKLIDLGYQNFPICVAKTQYSISDDPSRLGYPKNYEIKVRDVNIYTGAGFIVVYLGDIMTMPGLSRHPNYENIDMDETGKITGLF